MKRPTRSPTHADVDLGRLSAMGLELEDLADDGAIALPALVELAEDRGRPASHYLAALALEGELRLAGDAPVRVKVCAGSCQQWGALDLLDHLVERGGAGVQIVPVACLDRCDHAAACELAGPGGALVVTEATPAKLDEAIAAVAG